MDFNDKQNVFSMPLITNEFTLNTVRFRKDYF